MSLHILGEAYVYVCILLCVQLHICVQVQVYAGVYMCTCAVEISGQLLSLQQALSTFVFLRQGLSQLTWSLASKLQGSACVHLLNARLTNICYHA